MLVCSGIRCTGEPLPSNQALAPGSRLRRPPVKGDNVGREFRQKAELKRECVGISMKQVGPPGHFMER